MKTPKTLLTAGAIFAFSLGLAFAQQQPGDRPADQQQHQTQPGQPGQPGQQPGAMQEDRQEQRQQMGERADQAEEFHTIRASDLKGSRVVNADGDRLGTLEDLVVDIDDGLLSYAIVAAGGFLGIGADWRPVPPEAFEVREVALGIELVLDMTEDQWEQAPTVDRERIDQLAQEQRGQEIYEFYGHDWQEREQRIQEFAGPDRDREHDRDRNGMERNGMDRDRPDAQTQQIQEQLEQAMTQAGVEAEQAQQEAERLAQEISRDRPEQDEIEDKIEQALTRAGVDQDRAEQEAQRLSQQVQQQIEFAAPQDRSDRDRKDHEKNDEYGAPGERDRKDHEKNDEYGAPGEREHDTQADAQQQDQEFGAAQRQQQDQAEQVHLSGDLTDYTIVDQQQQEIGEINDFLVSLDEGRIAFVIFTEGTGMFPGNDEFAVAPQALEIRGDQAILNISQQELQQAQTLTRQQVGEKAREMAGTDAQQARQQPQVFRYQDRNGAPGVFGTPDRDRDRDEDRERDLDRDRDAGATQQDDAQLEQPHRQPPTPHQQESAQPQRQERY